MVNRWGQRYWLWKRLSFKYNDLRWHTIHIPVNWFSFSLLWLVERPHRESLRLNILQSDDVFFAQLGDLKGIEVSAENHFFPPFCPQCCPPTVAQPDVMNKCMSCLRGAGHAAFPPGMNHFDCHPPSSCTSPHCFHTLAEKNLAWLPSRAAANQQQLPILLLRRKSIGSVWASPCPMRRKRRDVMSRCDL